MKRRIRETWTGNGRLKNYLRCLQSWQERFIVFVPDGSVGDREHRVHLRLGARVLEDVEVAVRENHVSWNQSFRLLG